MKMVKMPATFYNNIKAVTAEPEFHLIVPYGFRKRSFGFTAIGLFRSDHIRFHP